MISLYIPGAIIAFFLIAIFVMLLFLVTIVRSRQILWIHKFYFAATIALCIWMVAIIEIRLTDPANLGMLKVWDTVTTSCAAVIPACSLLFAICYAKGYENRLPKRCWLLFAVPVLTIIMVATNDYHRLYYRVFSLESSTVSFGPYFYVHSLYTFTCVALSVAFVIHFAATTRMRLHMRQAALFTIGTLCPSIINLLIVTNIIKATIVTTPISFVVTIFLHGIIIYRFHLFDIKPIAMRELINWIDDGYLIMNNAGLVVSYNKPFQEVLGKQYGIRENVSLSGCVRNKDIDNKTAVYNLLTAIESCRSEGEKVTYEETITREKDGVSTHEYYMAEVSPLVLGGDIGGFLAILKDVTSIKINMQKLQENQVKMMERERLAFLGQTVAGLAHNLKTPIMSIAGSAEAIGDLTDECRKSVGDLEVTADDYKEIYEEMDGWIARVQEACAYMSDIISAVKSQAGGMNAVAKTDFSLDETWKRVLLLLRHELKSQGVALTIGYSFEKQDIMIHGDINNLVQVFNNLVSNAIDACKPDGQNTITVGITREEQELQITVADHGSGIPPDVRKKLFQEMVTSKGAHGTGLGILVSNTIIRSNFDGSMWFKDNPGGGTIWGVSLPIAIVRFVDKKDGKYEEE